MREAADHLSGSCETFEEVLGFYFFLFFFSLGKVVLTLQYASLKALYVNLFARIKMHEDYEVVCNLLVRLEKKLVSNNHTGVKSY